MTSGDTSGVTFHAKVPGYVPGGGPGVGGNLADEILRGLQDIISKYKDSLQGNDAQIKTIEGLAKQVAALQTMLSDIQSIQGKAQANALAGQIKGECESMLTSIDKINSPEARAALTAQVKTIEAMLSAGGVVSEISNLEKAVKQFQTLIAGIISGAISPSSGVAKELYDDYSELLSAVGYGKVEGGLDKLAAELKKILGSVPKALTDLISIASSTLNKINKMQNWQPGPQWKIYGPTMKRAMEQYAEGKKGDLEKMLENMTPHARSHDGQSLAGWGEANGDLSTLIRQCATANTDIKFNSGDILIAIKDMIQNKYGLSPGALGGLWKAYLAAINSANDITNQTSSMSNQQATSVQASITAMQSLMQSLEKDLKVPIDSVNKSLYSIVS